MKHTKWCKISQK